MFTKLIDALKTTRRTIVFTEGPDARILEATDRLKKDDLMDVILIGNVEEVKAAAAKGGFDIEGVEILDPATYEGMDEMVAKMVELRKGKMSAEDCAKALSKGNYFGTMLVKMGKADALLGGATYSTADTVRPALQLVKTKKGANLVSSCFIMVRGEEMLAMGDCAINISYEDKLDKEGNVTLSAAAQLAEVAVETAKTAKVFGIDPKVAMLSYSITADKLQYGLLHISVQVGKIFLLQYKIHTYLSCNCLDDTQDKEHYSHRHKSEPYAYIKHTYKNCRNGKYRGHKLRH